MKKPKNIKERWFGKSVLFTPLQLEVIILGVSPKDNNKVRVRSFCDGRNFYCTWQNLQKMSSDYPILPPAASTYHDIDGHTISKLPDHAVDHPAHYTTGKIECIDFIEDQQLTFHLGNAIKYIVRARHKGKEKEDLQKAIWYINRHLSILS